MKVSLDVWPSRGHRTDGRARRLRALARPATPRIPTCRPRSRRSATGSDRGARHHAARSAHRRNAGGARHVRSRHRRAAAADVRAGALGAAAGDHRPRRRGRLRPAVRERDARHRRPRRADEQRAALLGDLHGGRAARSRSVDVERHWPTCGRARSRCACSRCATSGRRATAPPTPPTPVRSDVPALILSGGLDPVTPPANGAEVAKTLPAQPPRRRARLRAHRVAARLRTAPHLRVHRRPRRSRRCPRRASSTSRRAFARRCGPTGSERAVIVVDNVMKAFGRRARGAGRRRRVLHRCRRRDHRVCSGPTAPARPRCCACSRR